MGVLHGNRDRVEPPGPNLVKSRDPLADPTGVYEDVLSVLRAVLPGSLDENSWIFGSLYEDV